MQKHGQTATPYRDRQRCELLTPVHEMARRRIGHLEHDRNRPASNHMPEGIP